MGKFKAMLDNHLERMKFSSMNRAIISRLIEFSTTRTSDAGAYVELLRMEPMLATRILGVVNSSWASPVRPVTQIDRAVTMLGLAHTRALALSFCLEHCHLNAGIDPLLSKTLWESSLLKAVAAQLLARTARVPAAEEYFLSGLFQDLGMPLFMALDADYVKLLNYPQATVRVLLDYELEHFETTHAAVGGVIAERMGLPARYLFDILEHHRRDTNLTQADTPAQIWINMAAGLLPHATRRWRIADLMALEKLVTQFGGHVWPNLQAFLEQLTVTYDELITRLSKDPPPPLLDAELLEQLAVANRQATTEIMHQQVRDSARSAASG